MNKEYNRCEIVGDLLPLYADGICSDESRAFVEDHIKECEKCRCTFDAMRRNDEEKLLSSEKKTALMIHGKKRDGRILSSILWAIVAAYVPIVITVPLFSNDSGLIPTSYPFELMAVFLITLPFLTSLISLGFTVSKTINWRLSPKNIGARDIAEAVAALVTAVACLNIQEMLYVALFGSLVSIILWVIAAVKDKRREIHKKTFIFCFFAVFTVFLAFMIAFTTVIETNGKRPERDEYATLQTDEAAL